MRSYLQVNPNTILYQSRGRILIYIGLYVDVISSYSMLPVSLDCSLLVALSVFSIVYILNMSNKPYHVVIGVIRAIQCQSCNETVRLKRNDIETILYISNRRLDILSITPLGVP